MDFSKIEINGKLLGVLNFNLMIPIEEEQLQLVDWVDAEDSLELW